MIILGIETSCDETAAALLEEKAGKFSILANVVSSQVKLHAKWGGVVPNLAAREHLKNITPVIKRCLKKAGKSPSDIDLIGVTTGPGLIPALLIGTTTAKTLSYLWNKPLIGIHHIEGHIYANFIRENPKSEIRNQKSEIRNPKFPVLCLVVSGGHTQLVLMKKHLDYEIIGQTQDDAAGEAFDKVARILGLGYPGGPAISAMAEKFEISLKTKKITGTKCRLLNTVLPRPMINSKNFNFSFSGLKTAVLYETKKHPDMLKNKAYIGEMCREFQQAVVDVLISKTISAAKIYRPKTIMLAGGVSANQELRIRLGETIESELSDILYLIPDTAYCIDNAAMIAAAACYRYSNSRNKKRFFACWKSLQAEANLKLTNRN